MAPRKSGKIAPRKRVRSSSDSQGSREISPSKDSVKAAEDLALAAFASGLKLAAAFGSVAAKTTSLALASLATGADKFSELVRQEALRSQKAEARKTALMSRARGNKRITRREPKRESSAS